MFEMHCFELKVLSRALFSLIFWETFNVCIVLYCACITVITAFEAKKLDRRRQM